jgi:hypothetical protein
VSTFVESQDLRVARRNQGHNWSLVSGLCVCVCVSVCVNAVNNSNVGPSKEEQIVVKMGP